MNRKRVAIVGLIATGIFLTTTAESCTHASNNNKVVIPTGPASVIQFPYGFRNVAYKCDGPNMIYSGSAGADDTLPPSIAVVPNDPRCTGK